jgi:hypothetical protein
MLDQPLTGWRTRDKLFGERLAWYPAGTFGKSDTAIELGFVGDTPYAFAAGLWTERAGQTRLGRTQPGDRHFDEPTRLAQETTCRFGRTRTATASATGGSCVISAAPYRGAAGDDLDGDLWSNLAEFLDNTDPRDPYSEPNPPLSTFKR